MNMEDEELKKAFDRLKKKGGTCSFSLEKGSYIQVNGEKRQTITKPCKYAREYFESKQVPKVIYL